MIAITLVLTLIVMSFILGAYPLGLVGILFIGVYLLYEINTPDMTQVSIDVSGVYINDQLYNYINIREFGIIRITKWPIILRLMTKSHMIINSIDVFVDPEIDVEDIRLYLAQYIPDNAQIHFSMIDRVLLSLRI